jgi:CheY-like chemotaxis protein
MSVLSPVLLAEDDEHDVFFMTRAFERAGVVNPLMVVRDGLEAINYLKCEGRYVDRLKFPFPNLLVLDLKMPACDGFEVLRWLKSQRILRAQLPVVVLTSSDLPRDRNRAAVLGAREFLVKPGSFNELVGLVRGVKAKWLDPTNERLPVDEANSAIGARPRIR